MSDAPSQTGATSVANMTPNERMQAAIERAGPLVGPDTAAKLKGFFSKEALVGLGAFATLGVVAQFSPIGWIADLAVIGVGALVVVGALALGYDIVGGLNDLKDFVTISRSAQNEQDLDNAAQHLAKAVSTLGIDTIQAIVLHETVEEASPKATVENIEQTTKPLSSDEPGGCISCQKAAAEKAAAEQGGTSNSPLVPSVPVAKFRDFIFKEGATHGKAPVFKELGYNVEDSEELAQIYAEQGAAKYAKGEYQQGKLDQYGQRIDIEIEMNGKGVAAGKTSYLRSGWMIKPDGSISLNTPFTGFTR